ncbi:HsdM family class I SAM-dependent methyltransferase [Nocardia farcinica]|uniref:site-specific DNA-methyltransferase (adenine-specific) n=1 Tax=Nocardia farcinica (strain IFM 10152) TaxID=247156 RepID=Q5YY36_NOCFA|nr:class I SAM-dependent DNA methyltransferase [Nocardia farcinica]BAD56905.1 putative restriction-modification system endonuclease/methyltransferase [Nocardia farcinica IFM 10152]
MTSDGLMRTTTARLFDACWAGGISNPLEVVDQLSHLVYLHELDRAQAGWDERGARSETIEREPIFAHDEQHLRWSHLVRLTPQRMFTTIADDVFPWLRNHEFKRLAYSRHVEDVRFTIPTPGLLAKVVDVLNEALSTGDAEAADLYEHLLAKVATAGRFGAFRTPLHLTALMVAMTAPGPDDEVCDPTCGTGGLLTAAAQFMLTSRSGTAQQSKAEVSGRLHGFDFDRTMLRLSSMRLALHGYGAADLRHRDNLSVEAGTEFERYSVVLANPPFAGSVDYETAAPELLAAVRTKKSEILHPIAILRLLKPGGRAAVIVPDGLLFGSTAAHAELRRILVEEHGLEAVVKLPSGTFKPYAGVSTAILFFTKYAGQTDYVWFYDLKADGWSLDDQRAPLLPEDKLGLTPESLLDTADHTRNNLPDLIRRWRLRNGSERRRTRSEQSFCVTRSEIAAVGYNLSLENFRRIHEMHRVAQEGVRLGDFAQIFTGSVRKSDLDMERDVADTDERRRVLTPTLLTDTLPDGADLPLRTDQREPQHRLRQGDIIGRDLAGNRHWTSVPSHYDGVQPGQGLIVVRLTQEVFPIEYVIAYLSSSLAEQQLPKYGTIPRVRASAMADIWIPKCEGDPSEIRASLAMLAEGEREAARIQNELRQARNQIFESGSGPLRRERLDNAAAISSLTAQNLRRHNDPYMLFQDSYPYAIARAVRKFRHSRSGVEKHEAAIQCAESLILSLGIMALALATDRGRQDLPAIAQWSQSVDRGGVSLGHWVGVVKAVADDARQHGEPAAGLVEATVRKKGGKGLIAELEQLVNLRNRIRHGAGPRTRAELEKSLGRIEPLMLSSLSGCAFLARTRWVHTERLRWHPNSGKFRVSGMALMGDHPDFATVTFDTARPLVDDRLYLITSPDAPLLLSPFCLLSDCPTCLAPELYYPDRMTNSTALLKSLDRGHELDSESVFKELREWSTPE